MEKLDLNNLYNLYNDLAVAKIIIKSHLKEKDSSIQKLMDNLGAAEGKMLRALFVLIGGSFGNIKKERLLNLSAAVELLHLATLVHDDVVDEAKLRRGKETIQSKFGIKSALFMGDYLFSESYVLFSKNSSPTSIMEVSETIKIICKGEIEQFFSTYSFEATVRDYLKRINGKCASLFSLSLSIGAFEAKAEEKTIKKLKRIGYYTGMAFQLIDDILDITSPDKLLGKPAGNDIKQGIYTLPALYEIRKGNKKLLKLLKDNIDKDNFILYVLDELKNSEGLKKSQELAKKYTNKALSLTRELPDICERQVLESIIEKMLVRNY